MSAPFSYKPLNTALPLQQVPLKVKYKKPDKNGTSVWMKDTMDAIEAIGRYYFFSNLPLRENYKIVSKEFDLKHYIDVDGYYDISSAIAQEFQVPYYLKHYDIIGKAVSLLVGEFLKRPDVFSVRASDSDTDNEYLRVQTELMQSYISQELNNEITQKMLKMGIDPFLDKFENEEEKEQYQQEIQAKYQELTPENIAKYMKYDYRSAAEHWGQATLSNDKQRFNLRELEKIEFTDMLIADRCFEHIFLTPTGYAVEPWNPVNTFFHVSPENRYAENGDYVGRTIYLTKTECIERYGWRMTRSQIEDLYPEYYPDNDTTRGNVYREAVNATLVPFPGYRDYNQITSSFGFDIFNSNAPLGLMPEYLGIDNIGYPSYQFTTGDIVQVTEAYWKSQRKLGKVSIADPETGEISTQIVDETFDAKLFGIKELEDKTWAETETVQQEPNTVIWTWVPQVWQGVKIFANNRKQTLSEDKDRNAIYVDVRPHPFQFKGDFTIFNPKLPVVGGVFNNRNAKSNSLVDLMKPYQIAVNAFYNLAFGTAQMNNGKFLLMNMRLLPKTKDWGGEQALDKMMSIARELKIVPVDDSTANIGGGALNFNQLTVHDLDETERIDRLIKFAVIFEEQGFRQIGITPQRQGQIQASETATGTQQSVQGSYAITEPYFENFYNYKRRKLNMMLDIAQYCASNKPDIVQTYITSDLGRAWIKTTGTEVFLKNLGVNIDNSQETVQELQMARQLALENNTTNLPMSGLLKIISLKSVADITKHVENLEREQAEQVKAQQEHEKQLQQMQIDAAKEQDQMNKQFEATENQLDRENKLQLEQLKAIGNEGSYDPEADTTGLLIEQGKLALDQSKASSEDAFRKQELVHKLLESRDKQKVEESKAENDRKSKEQDAKNKQVIENQKLKQIEKQNASQEKIEKESHENDMKLLKEKHKAEMEAKNKDLEIIDKKIEAEKAKAEAQKKIAVEKVKQIKVDTTVKQKTGDVKAKTEQELGKLKISEAKELSKDKKVLNKKKTKIQLKVADIKGKQAIKDAKTPPKKAK